MSGSIKKPLLNLFVLTSLSTFAFATSAATPKTHLIVAPQCLLAQINQPLKPLATDITFSLVHVNNQTLNQLISAKNARKTLCGGFMDATQSWRAWTHQHPGLTSKDFLKFYVNGTLSRNLDTNYSIQYPAQVTALFNQLNPNEMWNDLSTLTAFNDRYANSDNGVKAAQWIESTVNQLITTYQRKDITLYEVTTDDQYLQPSIVVKVGDATEPAVVIGAHLDTVQSFSTPKPGADDDGTGSVTVLNTLKTIVASGMTFKHPLYFMWYAAEEEGSVGSQYVVADFKKKNIPVAAVIQFDLTGYEYQNDPTLWLISDNVNPALSHYLETLITTYVKEPVSYTKCGYACSDHASWTHEGYIAAMPAESAFKDTNPNMHHLTDTMDKLSLAHMTDYLKLATAFAVELAEPTDTQK